MVETSTAHNSGQGASDGGAKAEVEQRTRRVGDTAKSEMGATGQEAKYQAQKVAGEAKDKARERADDQLDRTASMLDRFSTELRTMADGSSEPDGVLAGLARDGSSMLGDVAERLHQGGLDATLNDARRMARRHPVAFVAGATALGFGFGRLARNVDTDRITAAARGEDPDEAQQQRQTPSVATPQTAMTPDPSAAAAAGGTAAQTMPSATPADAAAMKGQSRGGQNRGR